MGIEWEGAHDVDRVGEENKEWWGWLGAGNLIWGRAWYMKVKTYPYSAWCSFMEMASPPALLTQSPICLHNPVFEIYLNPPWSLEQVKHSFLTLDAHWYILGLMCDHLWQQHMTEPILLLPHILEFQNAITAPQAKSVPLDVIQAFVDMEDIVWKIYTPH
jgi:hypothetical protein